MRSRFRIPARRITIVEPSLEGHRADQLAAIRSLLCGHDIYVDHEKASWCHMFTGDPLLFPTVDESFIPFLIIASVRAIFLRRTVAIWHRPKAATHGRSVRRWRRNAKYYAAKLIKFVPRVALISVQKPQFQPEVATLFTDWIHQIADWYAPSLDPSEDSFLFAKLIRQHAKGRPIIIYLGAITHEKGFEFFTDLLWEDRMFCNEFAFVAAGKVNKHSADVVHRFIKGGGLLVDRYIADSEFVVGIEAADWVWNCYPPENDQNSGIFGFAYRAGARVIVRDESYIGRVAS